jgi:hypothetical protein
MKSHDIYDDLVHTIPEEAVEYSPVIWWLRSEELAPFSESTHNSTKEPEITQTDQAVV